MPLIGRSSLAWRGSPPPPWIRAEAWIALGGEGPAIAFDERRDILWMRGERRPQHPNALRFTAFDGSGKVVAARDYFSVGGGFVRDEDEIGRNAPDEAGPDVPYPFVSGADLLARAEDA